MFVFYVSMKMGDFSSCNEKFPLIVRYAESFGQT